MADTRKDQHSDKQAGGARVDEARDNEENELEAEAESAAAMDADVPQPADDSGAAQGQPG